MMTPQPTLQTLRLRLRQMQQEDASTVQRLAGEKEIAAGTLSIPHRYPDGLAQSWIESHREKFERGEEIVFGIELARTTELIGAVGLVLDPANAQAELGYWVGKPSWGRGYCTEAARAVVTYGFRDLRLNRIHARHFASNPASGRVLQKIGMKQEGLLRQHLLKWQRFEDIVCYGMLWNELED